MQTEEVRPYYDVLCHKKGSILCKRLFDLLAASVLLILLSPVLLILAIAIKCDSRGPVFFRQQRVTTNGRVFRIFKFRTMVQHAERLGTQVTVQNDSRVTRMGHLLRKIRLDELPQLFNVLTGDMTFVGTRPEVPKYVAQYDRTMLATLLLPAGITSLASITFKDEDELLSCAQDADQVYVQQVLPEKMKYNLEYLKRFHFFYDLSLMLRTVAAVLHS